MLLHFILTRSFPFNPHNDESIKQFLRNKKLERPSSITDNSLWDLLIRMLAYERADRISASDALNHPFFKSPKAMSEITSEQIRLAQSAQIAKTNGDLSISQFDTDPLNQVQLPSIQQYPNQIQYGQQQPFVQQGQINPALLQPNPGAGQQQQQQFQPPGFGQQLQRTGIYVQQLSPVIITPKIPAGLQPVVGQLQKPTSQPVENEASIPCEICHQKICFSQYEEHQQECAEERRQQREQKRLEREKKKKKKEDDEAEQNRINAEQERIRNEEAENKRKDEEKQQKEREKQEKALKEKNDKPNIIAVPINKDKALKEIEDDKQQQLKDYNSFFGKGKIKCNTGKLTINNSTLIKCPYCQVNIQGNFERHLSTLPHTQAYWTEFHIVLKHHYDLLSRLPNPFKAPDGFVICPFCTNKHSKGKYEQHIITQHKHKSNAQFIQQMTEIIPHMRQESTGFFVTYDKAKLQCPFCNSLNNEYVEQHIWCYHKNDWIKFNIYLQTLKDLE
ncbi:MAG: hypothetical protein EZS28_009108 [Streblomastix strix]|uniref:Protein kinase domain-containing protein n=1 Tax=Streblomastix strix TaxID=222440 RepID=A0A5J4WKC8_9EUKA|nr:MAG: hypothetical protein EZS28_009108 [Streblomastix strix]